MKNQINIELENELKRHCPLLAQVQKEDWFEVSDQYFENAATEIKSLIHIEKSKTNAEKIFELPDQYFNQLSSQLLSNIKSKQQEKKARVIKILSGTIAVAASVFLFFIINQDQSVSNKYNVAALRTQKIKNIITVQSAQQYISEQPQSIDEQFLESNLSELQNLSSAEISNIPSSAQTDLSSYNEILVDASEVDFNLITTSLTN